MLEESNQLREFLVWIIHRDARRNVDEHASRNRQPQRIGHRTHHDLGHETRCPLSGATQLRVKHASVGVDHRRPRTPLDGRLEAHAVLDRFASEYPSSDWLTLYTWKAPIAGSCHEGLVPALPASHASAAIVVGGWLTVNACQTVERRIASMFCQPTVSGASASDRRKTTRLCEEFFRGVEPEARRNMLAVRRGALLRHFSLS